MAQRMFMQHGMTVDAFYAQDLELYMAMQYAEETQRILFIDEVE